MERGRDRAVPCFTARQVRCGGPTAIPHGAEGDDSRPGGSLAGQPTGSGLGW